MLSDEEKIKQAFASLAASTGLSGAANKIIARNWFERGYMARGALTTHNGAPVQSSSAADVGRAPAAAEDELLMVLRMLQLPGSEELESLKQKFTSGNSVPVERAVITRAEYQAIIHLALAGWRASEQTAG